MMTEDQDFRPEDGYTDTPLALPGANTPATARLALFQARERHARLTAELAALPARKLELGMQRATGRFTTADEAEFDNLDRQKRSLENLIYDAAINLKLSELNVISVDEAEPARQEAIRETLGLLVDFERIGREFGEALATAGAAWQALDKIYARTSALGQKPVEFLIFHSRLTQTLDKAFDGLNRDRPTGRNAPDASELISHWTTQARKKLERELTQPAAEAA